MPALSSQSVQRLSDGLAVRGQQCSSEATIRPTVFDVSYRTTPSQLCNRIYSAQGLSFTPSMAQAEHLKLQFTSKVVTSTVRGMHARREGDCWRQVRDRSNERGERRTLTSF